MAGVYFVSKLCLGYYRSDVGPDVGFEAVGLIDSKLETVGIWAKTKEDPPAVEVSMATPQCNKNDLKDTCHGSVGRKITWILYLCQLCSIK